MIVPSSLVIPESEPAGELIWNPSITGTIVCVAGQQACRVIILAHNAPADALQNYPACATWIPYRAAYWPLVRNDRE